jgi:hypothetical protein
LFHDKVEKLGHRLDHWFRIYSLTSRPSLLLLNIGLLTGRKERTSSSDKRLVGIDPEDLYAAMRASLNVCDVLLGGKNISDICEVIICAADGGCQTTWQLLEEQLLGFGGT